MIFNEHETVCLRRHLPEHGLVAGAVGVIVVIYDSPPAYEVEFCDHDGRTLALLTLREGDLEKTTPPD
jgi:hypothetical protein